MTKFSYLIAALGAVALQFGVPTQAQAQDEPYMQCETARVVNFWEENITGNILGGRGTVCTNPEKMWGSMAVNRLTRDNAYTVWWVYIDDPDSCVDSPLPVPDAIPFPEPENYAGRCGLADFFTFDDENLILDPLVVYGRMDSLIAKRFWNNQFSGEVRSFVPRSGSQVWMFLFGHGPADLNDKRQLARQLLTPEDPLSGVPHLGIEGRPFGYPAAVAVINIP